MLLQMRVSQPIMGCITYHQQVHLQPAANLTHSNEQCRAFPNVAQQQLSNIHGLPLSHRCDFHRPPRANIVTTTTTPDSLTASLWAISGNIDVFAFIDLNLGPLRYKMEHT
eukprot:6490323-Amphidinium_carterae.1